MDLVCLINIIECYVNANSIKNIHRIFFFIKIYADVFFNCSDDITYSIM